MATLPVYNPVIPYLGLMTGGLRVGQSLKITGQILRYIDRCQINIQTGAALEPRDDVVLHMSIRPQEHVIVRNHCQNKNWGTEERFGGCPIRTNQLFDILIIPEATQFKIMINNNHFCTFQHRLGIHLASFISISGGCEIQYIGTENGQPGNSGRPPIYPVNPPIFHPPIAICPPAPPIMHYPPHGGIHHHPPPPPPYPGYGPGPVYVVASPYSPKPKKDKLLGLKVAASIGALGMLLKR